MTYDIENLRWRVSMTDACKVWAVDPNSGASVVLVQEFATAADASAVVQAHNDALEAS